MPQQVGTLQKTSTVLSGFLLDDGTSIYLIGFSTVPYPRDSRKRFDVRAFDSQIGIGMIVSFHDEITAAPDAKLLLQRVCP